MTVHFKTEYRLYFLCEKALWREPVKWKSCLWHVCVTALQNQKKNLQPKFAHHYGICYLFKIQELPQASPIQGKEKNTCMCTYTYKTPYKTKQTKKSWRMKATSYGNSLGYCNSSSNLMFTGDSKGSHEQEAYWVISSAWHIHNHL